MTLVHLENPSDTGYPSCVCCNIPNVSKTKDGMSIAHKQENWCAKWYYNEILVMEEGENDIQGKFQTDHINKITYLESLFMDMSDVQDPQELDEFSNYPIKWIPSITFLRGLLTRL